MRPEPLRADTPRGILYTTDEDGADMRECTLADLEAAHLGGATVVDVREPDEYAAGHVPGALPIPMAQVPARLAEVPTGAPVYVICASGNRSKTSAQQLEDAGYDAYSVAGGTKGWIERGNDVVTEAEPR